MDRVIEKALEDGPVLLPLEEIRKFKED